MTRQYESIRSASGQLVLLAAMIFGTMFSRVLLSPVLIYLRTDLGLSTAGATQLFLPMALAYSASMLGSGFLARAILHRRTIALSVLVAGIGLIMIGLAPGPGTMALAFGVVGAGAGLYPPSGVASVTTLVVSRIRGKAISVHEMGPQSALIVAPLVVAALVDRIGWRVLVICCGAVLILLAIAFDRFSVAGSLRPDKPSRGNIAEIARKPEFWAITAFFALVACATLGVFSILPTFLVQNEGYDPQLINVLISISRVSGIAIVLASGYILDRFGSRSTLGFVVGVTGILTFALGLATGRMLLAAVLLQPMIISASFPAIVNAVAELTPPETRGISMSMMTPIVSIMSTGVFPALMGYLSDHGDIRAGFVVLGLLMVASLTLVRLVKDARA